MKWNKTRFCPQCGKRLGVWNRLMVKLGWFRCFHFKNQRKRYIVMPGFIGDEYISAHRLISLYKVDGRQCHIVDSPQKLMAISALGGSYVWLKPQADGDYSL